MAAKKTKEEAFEHITQTIEEVVRELGVLPRPPGVAAVTDDERLHFAPPRDDFEALVPKLRALAARTKVQLSAYDLDEMERMIAVAARLQPVLALMESVFGSWQTAVEHTVLKNRSRAWKIFTAYYTAISGIAVADGDIQAEYKALEAFFKTPKSREPKQANEDKESDTPARVVNG